MTEILETKILDGCPIIYFLKGLPGSGKSTWAIDKAHSSVNTIRINRDSIREMFHTNFSDRMETVTRESGRASGVSALRLGFNVVVDDTNLAKKNLNFWKALAEQHEYGLVEVFFNTEIEDCIARDALRPNPVGQACIYEMYNKYMSEHSQRYTEYVYQDPELDHAIIVDIDGTLALPNDRSPYDLEMIRTDTPNMPVINLVRTMSCMDKHIIIVSARKDICADATRKWLDKYLHPVSYILMMRKGDDERKDNVIKRELYDEYIRGKYYIEFVLDDRDSVVDLWRNTIGLPCFQVNYGNF